MRGTTTPYLAEADSRTRESAENEAIARLGHEELLSVMQLLPDDQRSVVVLRVLGDLSVRQTAEAMGRPESAVTRLQSKGLATLRRLLTVDADPTVSAQGASDRR